MSFIIHSWTSHCLWLLKVIEYWLHHEWDLTQPVEFLRCYTFLCNLANDLQALLQELEGLQIATIAQSLKQTSWRAPTLSFNGSSTKRPRNDGGAKGGDHEGDANDASDASMDKNDDLESDEFSVWHKSYKNWQLERKRAADDTPDSGLPLEGCFVKLHTEQIHSGYHRDRSIVEQWRSSVSS